MKDIIIVCGLNGSGKSTFARALADRIQYIYKDIEDYYFPNRCYNEYYSEPKSRDQVSAAMLKDLCCYEKMVIAAVKADYSNEISEMFTKAIYIQTPKNIRLKRVKERSFKKFGSRMQEGGDLYERETAFFDFVEKRSDSLVEDWLLHLSVPVYVIDGTRPVDENIEYILGSFISQ